ncbi:MAG TPA: cation diffusion facilitator family transporter [Polyangia bacterium]
MSHEHHHGSPPGHGGACAPPGALTAAAVRRVFVITLILNVAVASAKGGYGLLTGSIAVGSDAIHAVLDASSNVLALVSLRLARAPADDRHPYGRQKIEILAAVGIGVLIVFGLFELCEAAIRSLLGRTAAPRIGWGGFAVVAATMVTNFFIARYEERRGHALHSPLLCADAQHTRSDLYASIAVLLSFVGVRLGWSFADPLGAVCVIGLVGRAAWLVFRDNIPTLLDSAVLDPGRVAALTGQAAQVKQVTRVRSRGLRNAVHLDVRIDVDPGMSVSDAHELTQEIERTLRAEFPSLSDVTIHAAPSPASTKS